MPPNKITVFEHEALYCDRGIQKLSERQLKSLQLYNPSNKLPYYSLINNGVKFCEYVGVIQVGKTLIEVLPKADKGGSEGDDTKKWQDILISMLKVTGDFEVRDTSISTLKTKPNSILDLYFEKFISEVEYIYHSGLIKKYRKMEGNKTALKGRLIFSKDIQKNLVHKERFYVNYTIYDAEHILHIIIYKALTILKKINVNPIILSRIGSLLLLFPEMPDKKINAKDFDKIIYNRKTDVYKNAIGIARLIILNYHPDIKHGRNDVLALMFNMNDLWERFVYVSLKKSEKDNLKARAQNSINFWKPDKSSEHRKLRADILIKDGDKNVAVLDTKWKNIEAGKPAISDLQQMFVYNKYYKASKAALVYPGDWGKSDGEYAYKNVDENYKCSLIALTFDSVYDEESKKVDVREWQKKIADEIYWWVKE